MKKTKLAASTNTIKKVKPIIPEWKEVARRDCKYDAMSLPYLLEWIKESVPKGTPRKNVEIVFEVEEEPTYYDEIIVTVDMVLKVRNK